MQGGFHGLRLKQLSLILLALICTSIFFWTWEKTPLLTALFPSQSRFLQLSSDIVLGSPLRRSASPKPHAYSETNTTTPTERETVNEHKQQSFAAAAPEGAGKSSVHLNKDDSRLATISAKEKGISKSVPEAGTITAQLQIAEADDSKQSDLNVARVAPMSMETSSVLVGKAVNNESSLFHGQACNYAKGKWILDSTRPSLYSGSGCKQWLSPMWACQLTNRTDFTFEKLRWLPKGCRMDEFSGPKFLKRLQDKTLAFIGDSLGRQQFQSLMCILSGGEHRPDVIDVGIEYGLVKARGAIRPDGWAYRFQTTNTTILFYWSASLCDLQPLNMKRGATDYAMHLDRPPAFLQRFIHRFDILLLNTGHHWNKGKLEANHWVMHVGGVPNTNRNIAEIGGAKNFTIHSIVKWINSQLPKYPGLKVFYRTISPRHFVNGDWNTGGSCDNTTPMSLGKELLQDESSDSVAAGAVKGTRVKLLDVTALSQLRDDGHISRYTIRPSPGMQDCLHWCLPGIPDTWNEILFLQL